MVISMVMIGLINTTQEWSLSKKVCGTRQATQLQCGWIMMDHNDTLNHRILGVCFGSRPSCWIFTQILDANVWDKSLLIIEKGLGQVAIIFPIFPECRTIPWSGPLIPSAEVEPPQPRWHWGHLPENPRWIPNLNVESHSHNSFPSAIPILLLCVAKKSKYSKFLYGGFQNWGKPPVLIQFFRGFSMKPSSHWGSSPAWATSALWFERGLGFHPSKGMEMVIQTW